MSLNFSSRTTELISSFFLSSQQSKRVENDFETQPPPSKPLFFFFWGWSQSSYRVCFWKAAHTKAADPGCYWLGISGRRKKLTRPYLISPSHSHHYRGSIADDTHCPVAQCRTDQPFACPRWLANLYSKCPGMPRIKRKPRLVISLQLFPGLCRGAISPALKSEPLAMSQAPLPSSERLFIKSLSCF